MNTHRYIILACLAITLLLLASCTDTVDTVYKPDSQISFISVSSQIQSMLSTVGEFPVFIDLPDTTLQKFNFSGDGLESKDYPGVAYLCKNRGYQYPTSFYSPKEATPWVKYMHIDPGTHRLVLLDSAHNVRVEDVLELQGDQSVSVYYADSVGYFRSWALTDKPLGDAGKVGIRLLHTSPDAEGLFVTVEGEATPAGFPDSLKYGDATDFIAYDVPAATTLRLKFYHPDDSTTVVTRVSLPVVPEESYTLTLRGYVNAGTYVDPVTNKTLPKTPLTILSNKNY